MKNKLRKVQKMLFRKWKTVQLCLAWEIEKIEEREKRSFFSSILLPRAVQLTYIILSLTWQIEIENNFFIEFIMTFARRLLRLFQG